MNTVIIYASTHHGNTKKIVEKMAEVLSADLVDITKNKNPDITAYDVIGFGSGIYFHSMHKNIQEFISKTTFSDHQKIFLVDTCGVGYKDYTKGIKKVLKEKKIECLGSFQCRGFDTYGIFGKFGGIAKGHPDDNDYVKAENFAKTLMQGR